MYGFKLIGPPLIIFMIIVIVHRSIGIMLKRSRETSKVYKKVNGVIVDCDIKCFIRPVYMGKSAGSRASYSMIMSVQDENGEVFSVVVATAYNSKIFIDDDEWDKEEWINENVSWWVSHVKGDKYYHYEPEYVGYMA